MVFLRRQEKAQGKPCRGRRTRLFVLFCAAAVSFCLSGCRDAPLLYVNGEPVTEEELALLDQDTDEAVRMKVLQQWAKESGVIRTSFSLKEMLREMEAENRDRVKRKAEGGIVYGVTEYTPLQYYRILMGDFERALKDGMMEDFSEEELEAWYEAHRENFRQIGEIVAAVEVLSDGHVVSEGEISLSPATYRTLSEQNEELAAAMEGLWEGGEAAWTDDQGMEWRVRCLSREPDSYQPFEDVRGAVSEQCAEERLQEELEERILESEVKDLRK